MASAFPLDDPVQVSLGDERIEKWFAECRKVMHAHPIDNTGFFINKATVLPLSGRMEGSPHAFLQVGGAILSLLKEVNYKDGKTAACFGIVKSFQEGE